MRVAETKKYKPAPKSVHKIGKVEPVERTVILLTPKQKLKFIKKVEMLVRSSQEYKQYSEYLKKYVDMTMCSFFNGITTKNSRKVRIEIHHEPFTLFDLVSIVLEKWTQRGDKINHLLIAEEVMKIHFRGRVGLIPLSLTAHQLVHDGKLFIPLQYVYGDVIEFVKEYEQFISEDLMGTLQVKLEMSKQVQDNSILDTSYVYIEVDGFSLPQKIER